MINIDDRLLKKVDANQLWLLVHITKRIGKNDFCWPSNKMLCRETGWHIEKLQNVKKSLIDAGLVEVFFRRHSEGGQGANGYKITTPLIGVYVTASEVEFSDDGKTDTGGKTDTAPHVGKSDPSPTGKSNNEVLTNEVLTNIPASAVPVTKGPLWVLECYKPFIKTWCDKYPLLLTMPKDGAKVKSIIRQVGEILKTENWEVTAENACNFWTAFVGNLHRTWGHQKDLSTIDSKLKSLFLEMKPGRSETRRDSWETEFQQNTKY
jgi:hypothetical protein